MAGTCYLDDQRALDRREGRWLGMVLGSCLGVSVMIAVNLGLSMYADQKHEQAVASIKQADALLLDECKLIVRDLAEEEYSVVVDYRHQIDRIQQGRSN